MLTPRYLSIFSLKISAQKGFFVQWSLRLQFVQTVCTIRLLPHWGNNLSNSDLLPMYMPTLERAAAYARNDNSLPVQFTQEDEERFFNLLSEVNNTALYDDTLKNIIMENSSAFVNGDRSLGETIKLIQSKASLYLAELG